MVFDVGKTKTCVWATHERCDLKQVLNMPEPQLPSKREQLMQAFVGTRHSFVKGLYEAV